MIIGVNKMSKDKALYRVKVQPLYKNVKGTGKDSSVTIFNIPRISKITIIDKDGGIVAHIPDYVQDAEELAKTICTLLNNKK